MRLTSFFLLAVLLAGMDGTVRAQARFDAKARANAVAPFVDELTIGVAHADLSRVDFGRLLKHAAELAPGAEDVAAGLRSFQPLVEHLIKSGGNDVYLVISLADLPQPPLVVVPLADGADVDALQKLLGQLHCETVERVGEALVAGRRVALDRVKAGAPAARPELARAFEAAGDTAAQLLLLPSADSRRVVEELLPTLPAEVGGGSSKVLTRGVMWAAAGFDFSPQPAIKLVVQSQDHDAAAAFHDKWAAVLQLIGRDARVEKAVPQFKQLAGQLEPVVKGDRLLLALDAQGPASKTLEEVFKIGLAQAQQNAARERMVSRFKQIGLAMQNYADVYKSFPAAASYSDDGKPLLSWRVLILPFLDQAALYKEFRLDEPWDSEHNRKLIERMPEIYRSANWSPKQPTKTCFVVVTSEGSVAESRKGGSGAGAEPAAAKVEPATAFQGREGVWFADITDGTSNTIMVVQSDSEHAVVWTKPEDLPFDPEAPTKGFGADADGWVGLLFCDGSWRRMKLSLEPETWRRLLLRNDGHQIPND